jgi:hypothetical protein
MSQCAYASPGPYGLAGQQSPPDAVHGSQRSAVQVCRSLRDAHPAPTGSADDSVRDSSLRVSVILAECLLHSGPPPPIREQQLIIIGGEEGAGKSTIVRALLLSTLYGARIDAEDVGQTNPCPMNDTFFGLRLRRRRCLSASSQRSEGLPVTRADRAESGRRPSRVVGSVLVTMPTKTAKACLRRRT